MAGPPPHLTPPGIVRAAYAELVVTDLGRAREFWVDVLGFVVTAESRDALYLRGYDELIHHNLILRAGPLPTTRSAAPSSSSSRRLRRAPAAAL